MEFPIKDTFGWRFKQALEENGAPVTQAGAKEWLEQQGRELGLDIEISTTMIFRYYRDEMPRIDQGLKYAIALGVSVDWLYSGREPKLPLDERETKLLTAFRAIGGESEKGRALGIVEGLSQGREPLATTPPQDDHPTQATERQAG